MAISGEKWAVISLLFVISLILGLFPYFLLPRVKSWGAFMAKSGYQIFLTVLSCFGAGVLLTTAICHMLPENREALSEIASIWNTLDEHFPLAETLTLSGFAMLYFVEELAHLLLNGASAVPGHGHSHQSHPPQNETVSESKDDLIEEEEVHVPPPAARLLSIIAFIALSFHGVMEGIAVGVENSSGLWFMFGAIAPHEFLLSFCVGMELCAARAKFRTVFPTVFIFAMLSSIGIAIGSSISSENEPKGLAVSILQGFATGTILYIVFFEILSRERERRSGGLRSVRLAGLTQFISVTVGLVAMALFMNIVPHEHNHDHDHGDCHDDHDHDHPHVIDSSMTQYKFVN